MLGIGMEVVAAGRVVMEVAESLKKAHASHSTVMAFSRRSTLVCFNFYFFALALCYWH